MKTETNIDGYHVIEEFLLTKGEEVVSNDKIQFKPLVDFALIIYGKKCNATNRLAMKFELERFFMRNCVGELSGTETKWVKVPKSIYDKVKIINDKYRGKKQEDE